MVFEDVSTGVYVSASLAIWLTSQGRTPQEAVRALESGLKMIDDWRQGRLKEGVVPPDPQEAPAHYRRLYDAAPDLPEHLRLS